MSNPTIDQLREVDLFEGLSDEELGTWARAAELRELAKGEVLMDRGETAKALYLVLDGSLQAIAVGSSGAIEPFGEHRAPTWVGAVGALTGGVSGVRMQALTRATIAVIERDRFVELALAHRPVFERVIVKVRPVLARVAAAEQNREHLASLGTMAAGLAHELNNPAAAARRAASDLAEALAVLSSTVGHFVESGLERSDAQQLVELQREALERDARQTRLGALDAADAEDELLAAIEELDVREPWTLAPALAAAGLERAWLERVASAAKAATEPALRWVAASLTASELAKELGESTARMSELVGAVKSYAYMDRGELVEADVHEGLETTLAVLAHKLKHTSIEVRREYDRSLPHLMIYGGELNQVWTNLLDNAIAAIGESGTITISTARDGPCVRVDVADDGVGIEPSVLERIFDPFFTTKGVGEGTGLGLDTSRRIVVDRHRGSIEAESTPGRTVFHVWLPIAAAAQGAAGEASVEASPSSSAEDRALQS